MTPTEGCDQGPDSDPAPAWAQGWYREARRLDSPNCGPRPKGMAVDLVVLHSISLPPGAYGGSAVQQLFTNTLDWDAHPYYQQIRGLTVSAHFFVRRDGSLWQFVSCDARAWHAGASCHQGRDNCNDFSIGIELEGLEGELFAPVQYRVAADLCTAIRGNYPIRQVVGHEHVAPGRKFDPGAGFDWPLLRQSLAWGEDFFPPTV
jgi:N-acetyl-anhydromuramyl-L-alanine amidase AmpD